MLGERRDCPQVNGREGSARLPFRLGEFTAVPAGTACWDIVNGDDVVISGISNGTLFALSRIEGSLTERSFRASGTITVEG